MPFRRRGSFGNVSALPVCGSTVALLPRCARRPTFGCDVRQQAALKDWKQRPTQKPLKLLRYLVEDHTNEGDLVLDPFCGTGTTIVAAQQLKRHYLGIEVNPEYAAFAEQRITMKTADPTPTQESTTETSQPEPAKPTPEIQRPKYPNSSCTRRRATRCSCNCAKCSSSEDWSTMPPEKFTRQDSGRSCASWQKHQETSAPPPYRRRTCHDRRARQPIAEHTRRRLKRLRVRFHVALPLLTLGDWPPSSRHHGTAQPPQSRWRKTPFTIDAAKARANRQRTRLKQSLRDPRDLVSCCR